MVRFNPPLDAGLAIACLGGLAWVLAGLYYSSGALAQFVLGLLVATIGFGLASYAHPTRPRLAALAWLLVLLGMYLFLGPGFLRFNNLARIGTHVFLLGGILLLTATFLGAGARPTHRAGVALALIAGVFWIIADLDGGLAWQPGNLIAMVGLAWSGVRPPYRAARERRAATRSIAAGLVERGQ